MVCIDGRSHLTPPNMWKVGIGHRHPGKILSWAAFSPMLCYGWNIYSIYSYTYHLTVFSFMDSYMTYFFLNSYLCSYVESHSQLYSSSYRQVFFWLNICFTLRQMWWRKPSKKIAVEAEEPALHSLHWSLAVRFAPARHCLQLGPGPAWQLKAVQVASLRKPQWHCVTQI